MFCPKPYKAGVLRIRDLLDNNGKILDFKAFMTTFQVECNILLYYKIIKAIPPNRFCEIEQCFRIDKQPTLTNNHCLFLFCKDVALDIHKTSTKLIFKFFAPPPTNEIPTAISKWEITYNNIIDRQDIFNYLMLVHERLNYKHYSTV